MDISILDYSLPSQLIALYPDKDKRMHRMMVINKSNRDIGHFYFKDIVSFLNRGDIIIFNNTGVIKARIFLERETGSRYECVLIKPLNRDKTEWEALIRRGGRLLNKEVSLANTTIKGLVKKQIQGDISFILEFDSPITYSLLDRIGEMPIPPYIRKKRDYVKEDDNFYQSVFASIKGSVAAPTASLHFDDKIIEAIKQKGVFIDFITLHVGWGTFSPIRADKVEEHKIHSEYMIVKKSLMTKIKEIKSKGGRVFAIGTTVCRALESAARVDNDDFDGFTDLYIYPPFRFRVVDALLTNFHAPRSSLLALVMAFAGIDIVKLAYKEAIKRHYKFLSYGDCMLIL